MARADGDEQAPVDGFDRGLRMCQAKIQSPSQIVRSAGSGDPDDWVGISYGVGGTVLNTPHGVILPAP